jgi:long-chain acyl-CoA synthetase
MNLATALREQAARTPEAPALAWEGGGWTYRELERHARRFASLLAARGVGAGDRVAMLLPNHPAFAVALVGTLWRGAVAAVLSPAWTPADAARALVQADARLLVTTDALHVATGSAGLDALLVGDDGGLGALGETLDALPGEPSAPPASRDRDDLATILFSSGTTGDPKGVMLTHGNLRFNAAAKIRCCGITPTDRLAMVVPMAHCFGQNVVLLGALLAGASVRLFVRFDAEAVAQSVAEGGVSMLLAAPTAFERLLALGDGRPLRPLRYALSAAAPPHPTLGARWREAAGVALAQGYGLTECSPFATYDADSAGAGDGVGRAIRGVDVRVAAEQGDRWAPAGAIGEIVVRGPNVMAGYWRRPADTAMALRGGWLRTGDVGRLDRDGTVHLVGRRDDVINVAGFKAWPSDVERALAAHPAVLECASYAVPDAGRGARVGAAVVLRHGTTVSPDALLRFAAERLAGFQRPARLRFVDALPRGASGKLLRRVLAEEDHGAVHETPPKSDRPATAFPAPSR